MRRRTPATGAVLLALAVWVFALVVIPVAHHDLRCPRSAVHCACHGGPAAAPSEGGRALVPPLPLAGTVCDAERPRAARAPFASSDPGRAPPPSL